MTTDELIEKLKSLGVADSDAEGMRELHIQSANVGQRFNIPVLAGAERETFVMVKAEFTGEDELFVPKWLGIDVRA